MKSTPLSLLMSTQGTPRNSILVNFYDEKVISQNFSSPYTPEQNGVAERKKQNPHRSCKNNAFRIFYIHNHKDHLGKFDEKADDGYLLGYSLVSKAFRVFNTRFQPPSSPCHSVRQLAQLPEINMLKRVNTKYYYPKLMNHIRDIKEILGESSPREEDTSVQNTIPISNPPLPIPPVATPAPQDIWSQDKYIDLVNIIGNLGSRMLTRAMAKELGAASAHECLFVDFLFEEEPKKVFDALQHLGWVDAMQYELNQFDRAKVWTLVPAPYGKTIIGSKWVFRNKRDETGIVIKNKARLVAQDYNLQEGIDYDETFAPVARLE
ncbi:retrovirus-related pol polyprotein from transposon TNT 1-94 [Tanacetum coccineum]|uniref:Retrovirus-related pol polyprotein from transposon TNT 1-94 n=1 Tax=Tanacetum coccineum TaxID=301880 RepID=A0ABQ5JAJ1_9ASTR